MDTLLRSHVRLFGGAPLTEIVLKTRRSGLTLELNTAARLVEILLNDPRNRWIILGQWWKSAISGTDRGIIIETDCLCLLPSCKYCVKGAIEVKPLKKTKGDDNAKPNKSGRVRRARSNA